MSKPAVIPIPQWILFAVYGIVPMFLLVIGIDMLLLESTVREMLPSTPWLVVVLALLFNVPHQVASFFSLADREYLSFYRTKLVGLVAVLVFFGLLLWYAPFTAFVFFILYTEYHIMAQQDGVLRLLSRTQLFLQTIWKWLGVVILATGYGIWLSGSAYGGLLAALHLYDLAPFLIIIFVALSVWLAVRVPPGASTWFVVAVGLGTVSGYLFLANGYPLLALIAGRIVHDVTAFCFYIVHDYNRNLRHQNNVLYNFFSFTKLPVYILTPVLAAALAFLLQRIPVVSATALFFLFIAHYYIESFIWKRDGLHRHQIRVV